MEAFKHFEGKHGEWGICVSLLIVDDKVIYTPGGSRTTMVALDKSAGRMTFQGSSGNKRQNTLHQARKCVDGVFDSGIDLCLAIRQVPLFITLFS